MAALCSQQLTTGRSQPLSISAVLQTDLVRSRQVVQTEDVVPGALDVFCGICGTVLWRGLRDYCLHDGQQAHIQSELTTRWVGARPAWPPVLFSTRSRSLGRA